jgi:hypothetical protein
MQIRTIDFNGADHLLGGKYLAEWSEIKTALERMPLHLKASDQAKKVGNPIFDVVGTNEYIKHALRQARWSTNIPIPQALKFLGTDVDFAKRGVIAEVQFSNYPFLLNNLLRSELFYKNQVTFTNVPPEAAVIITKAGMFPASNSTLYYEQAENQLRALSQYTVFSIPIRLVGLFEAPGSTVDAMWSQYSETRYSRTVKARDNVRCYIGQRVGINRPKLTIV